MNRKITPFLMVIFNTILNSFSVVFVYWENIEPSGLWVRDIFVQYSTTLALFSTQANPSSLKIFKLTFKTADIHFLFLNHPQSCPREEGFFKSLTLFYFSVVCYTSWLPGFSPKDRRIKSLFLLRLVIFLVASFVNFKILCCSQAFKFNLVSSTNIFSSKRLYIKILSKWKTRLFFSINALYKIFLMPYDSDDQLPCSLSFTNF